MYSKESIDYLKNIIGGGKVEFALRQIKKGKRPVDMQNGADRRTVWKVKNALEAMEGYEKAWWLSDDEMVFVTSQLMEKNMLIPVQKFIKGINNIFDMDIKTEEELVTKLVYIRKKMKISC